MAMLLRLRLFFGIVWRWTSADYRLDVRTAWKVARIIHS